MKLKLAPHYLPGGEVDTVSWLQLKQGDQPALAVAKLAMLTAGWIADQRTKPEENQRVLASIPPGLLVIGKPDENFQERYNITATDNPEALAAQYAAEIFDPLIAAAPEIPAWEGPNEIAIAPDEVSRMQCYSEFLKAFAFQMQRRGKRAVIGAWAVGTPDFSLWRYYVPALEACRDYGAILSRHSYGPLDQYYSYRHRLDEAEFRKLGFSNMPVIISECGADGLGVPGWATWRRMFNNDAGRYWNEYLLPFTQEIEKDLYVIGATLFTVGSGFQWADFDVAGMGLVPHVAAYTATLPIDAPATPTKETLMEEFSFITTLLGTGTNTAALHDFLFKVHDWLAKHGGSITGFGEAAPWWKASTLPKFCTLRPEFGKRLLYWPSPDVALKPTLFPNPVTWQMEVFSVQGDMALVNQTPPMWIPAAYAHAVN